MTDLIVTQADRDAAAELIVNAYIADRVREGRQDDHPYVQAFARHRLASLPAQPEPAKPANSGEVGKLIERLRVKLEELLYEHDPMCGGEDCIHTARAIAPLLATFIEAELAEVRGKAIEEIANAFTVGSRQMLIERAGAALNHTGGEG